MHGKLLGLGWRGTPDFWDIFICWIELVTLRKMYYAFAYARRNQLWIGALRKRRSCRHVCCASFCKVTCWWETLWEVTDTKWIHKKCEKKLTCRDNQWSGLTRCPKKYDLLCEMLWASTHSLHNSDMFWRHWNSINLTWRHPIFTPFSSGCHFQIWRGNH